MRPLHQFRRVPCDDGVDLIEKRLRARLQRRVRRLRHLSGDDFCSRAQPGPVVVGKPERHFDLEYIEQLEKWLDQPEDTVLAPMAYSSVRSQPMIHAKSSPRVA